jgi:hypothetical protein
MMTGSLQRNFLVLSVAALAAVPAMAGAQGATGGGACVNCRTRELTSAERERIERVRKELERVVDRARDRVAQLRESSEYRETEARAMRQALIALEQAEPRTPEIQMALARLESLRVQEQPRFLEDQELKNTIKEMMRLEQELTLRTTSVRTQPRGYLGVTFSSNRTVDRAGRISFTVDDYPKILSVESDSPAAHAGVKSGDVLLAMNGRDVVTQGPIPLSDFLRPGETVKLRLLRSGRKQELPVRVGLARETRVFVAPRAEPGATSAPIFFPQPPAAPSSPRVRPREARPAEAPVWISGGEGFSVTFVGTTVILGAQLQPMDRDHRDVLDVDEGMLVTKVQERSLAESSGLHSLDVIQRADGDRVRSADDLRQAITRAQANGADSVVVTVVRKKKEQKVTLRW